MPQQYDQADLPDSEPIAERDTIDLEVPADHAWKRLIIDRNPFFLLSGLSMFAGCFLVSREIHSTDPSAAGFVGMLVGLIVVMNLYEAAVIALGVMLSRSRALVRDARHLIGLGLLLMIDVAFVYNETATADLALGATLAGIAGLLAIVKLVVITRLLGIRLRLAGLVVISVTLTSLYAMPVTFRVIADDGFVSLPAMLAVWAAVGVIIAGYAVPGPGRWATRDEPRNTDHQQLQVLVRFAVIALPLGSLVAHALLGLWVYGTTFTPALLAPAILGAAAVVIRQHVKLGGIRPALRAAMVLMLAAVVATLRPPTDLLLIFDNSWLSLSPLRGTLVLSSVMLAWAWWIAGGLMPAIVGVLMFVISLFGHGPAVMWANLHDAIDRVFKLLPESRLGWGVTAVGLAFALLIIGGAISYRRHQQDQQRADAIRMLSGPNT